MNVFCHVDKSPPLSLDIPCDELASGQPRNAPSPSLV
jgi:hypothetical protein